MRYAQALERAQRDFGLRIRELRRGAGLTQKVAAGKVGMQTQNFARIEQGVMNVTLETIVRLALLFEVEFAELLSSPKPQQVRMGRPRKSDE